MEDIKVKEYLKIRIDHYPYHKTLNEKIIEDAKMLHFYPPEENYAFTNIMGSQYNFDVGKEPDSIKILLQWIRNIIFTIKITQHKVINPGSSWLAKYNKGDYTIKHDHSPSAFSFVYFVRSPKGSSPLVFSTSGKRINPEEGKVVIFPGTMLHHVPKNKVDGRMTYAGNITITSEGY